MDIYTPSNLAETQKTTNRWITSRTGQRAEDYGKVYTVRDAGVAVKAVTSFVDPPNAVILPAFMMEVLKKWGCCWMWKTLRLICDEDWTKGAIEREGHW